MELRAGFRGLTGASGGQAQTVRVGIMNAAVTQDQTARLMALFPAIRFEYLSMEAADATSVDILFVPIDAASPEQVENVLRQCRLNPAAPQTVIVLRNGDLSSTRALLHSGAADVLMTPVSDAALALCLERMLARDRPLREPSRAPGQLNVLLKAGGGVGATSLGVQAASLIAAKRRSVSSVCFADLDLQFGAAGLYFDMNEALTVTDCLAVGEFLGDTQFATALSAHESGVRVLAAPRDVTPLDAMTPALAEALLTGLKRDFAMTILDLPSVWTPWTDRALKMADRIVLVTRLSVPHVHMVRRQLHVLSLQKLDGVPLTLVCNGVNSDRQNMLSVKAAERSIGRSFDILVPEDLRVMEAACNQGQEIGAVRRGTKLEKMIAALADAISVKASVGAAASGLR